MADYLKPPMLSTSFSESGKKAKKRFENILTPTAKKRGFAAFSVIAAAVLTVIPEMLRALNTYRMLIYAVILILVMIFSQNEQLVLWRMRLKHKVTAAFGAHRRKGA